MFSSEFRAKVPSHGSRWGGRWFLQNCMIPNFSLQSGVTFSTPTACSQVDGKGWAPAFKRLLRKRSYNEQWWAKAQNEKVKACVLRSHLSSSTNNSTPGCWAPRPVCQHWGHRDEWVLCLPEEAYHQSESPSCPKINSKKLPTSYRAGISGKWQETSKTAIN